jgi:aldose 1-epimerase
VSERLVLRAGNAELTIDPAQGGRFASLLISGREVLVTEGFGPIEWGCYAMAPFAGRIRDARFTFRGHAYELEANMPPNAIHGTVFTRQWDVVTADADQAVIVTDLGPAWPFRGRVTHSVAVRASGLDARLDLDAAEPMPAWLGWHPWFRRDIAGATAELEFAAERMYARGPDGLPTGQLVEPVPGPWDDAFVGLMRAPRLSWPGVLTLEIDSPAPVWVVYDERPDKLCVEPQTAPPDAVNLPTDEPPVVEPGRPGSLTMSWRWRSHAIGGA